MILPMILNLKGPIVIFGGGKVAKRKVDLISKFSKDIVLITETTLEMPDFVEVKNVKLKAGNFQDFLPKNIKEIILIVAALSDKKLNRSISKWAQSHGILVNVADDPEFCTIFFPAISSDKDLHISISTSGKCPFLSKEIRKEIDKWISNKSSMLEILKPIRVLLKGHPNKNDILLKIYSDPRINEAIQSKKIEDAKKISQEIYNVCI